MKKIIAIILCITLLVGCSNKKMQVDKNNDSNINTDSEIGEDVNEKENNKNEEDKNENNKSENNKNENTKNDNSNISNNTNNNTSTNTNDSENSKQEDNKSEKQPYPTAIRCNKPLVVYLKECDETTYELIPSNAKDIRLTNYPFDGGSLKISQDTTNHKIKICNVSSGSGLQSYFDYTYWDQNAVWNLKPAGQYDDFPASSNIIGENCSLQLKGHPISSIDVPDELTLDMSDMYFCYGKSRDIPITGGDGCRYNSYEVSSEDESILSVKFNSATCKYSTCPHQVGETYILFSVHSPWEAPVTKRVKVNIIKQET